MKSLGCLRNIVIAVAARMTADYVSVPRAEARGRCMLLEKPLPSLAASAGGRNRNKLVHRLRFVLSAAGMIPPSARVGCAGTRKGSASARFGVVASDTLIEQLCLLERSGREGARTTCEIYVNNQSLRIDHGVGSRAIPSPARPSIPRCAARNTQRCAPCARPPRA